MVQNDIYHLKHAIFMLIGINAGWEIQLGSNPSGSNPNKSEINDAPMPHNIEWIIHI